MLRRNYEAEQARPISRRVYCARGLRRGTSRNATMPSGAAGTVHARQILPEKVSGGSGDDIQHEDGENGSATRPFEWTKAGPLPQGSTESTEKAAYVSTKTDVFLLSREHCFVVNIIYIRAIYFKPAVYNTD